MVASCYIKRSLVKSTPVFNFYSIAGAGQFLSHIKLFISRARNYSKSFLVVVGCGIVCSVANLIRLVFTSDGVVRALTTV